MKDLGVKVSLAQPIIAILQQCTCLVCRSIIHMTRLTHCTQHYEVVICAVIYIQVELGRGLGGEGGVTIQGLLSEGYEAVFIGIGLPDPKVAPIFKGLIPQHGFFTSKDFLPDVCKASKPGEKIFSSA